jgi:hypothetical protein
MVNGAPDYENLFRQIARRYGGASPEAIRRVLQPVYIPVNEMDKTIFKAPGQAHYRATFFIDITPESSGIVQVARTGKFVSAAHMSGAAWAEICKGRIVSVDHAAGRAEGEIYVGSSPKAELELALKSLQPGDFWEVDQFGVAAKFLSALVEAELARTLQEQGYIVRRLPEDTARHLGHYANYDFDVIRGVDQRRVEVKSIWGTNTKFARLIHSKSTGVDTGLPNFYKTSSCKFATQDIFAVSLFLRTGSVSDFAFARSVPRTPATPHGLPAHSQFPEYVNQNPLLTIGDGTWFETIDEVWDLP